MSYNAMTGYVSVSAGHTNNVHCLAKAVNALAGALFTVHGPGDVEMRLKEFLAVSLSNISYSDCDLSTDSILTNL